MSLEIPVRAVPRLYPGPCRVFGSVGVNIKRILLIGLAAFVVYYVLRSPDAAAAAFRGAGETTFDGIKDIAQSLARFFDKLLA